MCRRWSKNIAPMKCCADIFQKKLRVENDPHPMTRCVIDHRENAVIRGDEKLSFRLTQNRAPRAADSRVHYHYVNRALRKVAPCLCDHKRGLIHVLRSDL